MIKRFLHIVIVILIALILPAVPASGQSIIRVAQGSVHEYKIDKNSDIVSYAWEVFSDYSLQTTASQSAVELTTLGTGRENEISVTWKAAGEYYLTVTTTGENGCINKMAWHFIVNADEETLLANKDTITTYTGTPVQINILDNDTYTESVTITITDTPKHGTYILNSDGSVTYTPEANYSGNDTLIYAISNTYGSDTAIVVITIKPLVTFAAEALCVSETPYLSWNMSVAGSSVSSIDIKLYDINGNLVETIDGAPLSSSILWPGVQEGNGTITVPSETETITVNAEISEISSQIYSSTVKVPDCSENHVYATADTATICGQGEAIDVIYNDYDNDEGDIDTSYLSITDTIDNLFQGPFHGTAIANEDGTITYTPDYGYAGIDSFTYTICDDVTGQRACDTAVVRLQIFFNTPIVANDDSYFAYANQTNFLPIYVLSNDSDYEGQINYESLLASINPKHGNVYEDTQNGTIMYRPDPLFIGIDSFMYSICDINTNTQCEASCDSAWVYITVSENQSIVANPDDTTTLAEQPVVINILNNDWDPENELDSTSLKIVVTDSSRNGYVDVLDDHTIVYMPYDNFAGLDSFIYQVCDDGYPELCDTAIVRIEVVNNNLGIVANPDTASTVETDPLVINILDNDYDPDTVSSIDISTISIVGAPNHGTVTINSDGSLTYVANSDYSGGYDTLIYQVCDDAPIMACDTALVVINVKINRPPVAESDTIYAVNGTSNILPYNAYDPEGELDSTSITIITQPANGTLTINGTTGNLEYVSSLCYFQTDSFTYTIADEQGLVSDTATVYIVVSINKTLDSDNDNILDYVEDLNQNGTPCDDDTDSDGIANYLDPDDDNDGILTIVEEVNNDTDNDGIVNYLDADDDGDCVATIDECAKTSEDCISADLDGDGIANYLDNDDDGDGVYTCDELGDRDGNGIADYLEIWDSKAVDDYSPIGLDMDATLNVLLNDSSQMADSTIRIITYPEHGTVTINTDDWTITYTPTDADFMGQDSFTYVVCDYYDVCDTAVVIVDIDDVVSVPEIFTPNGDGDNETLIISGIEHYSSNTLEIYNRWGNLVYKKSGYQNDFDGNSNMKYTIGTKSLPVGSYYYILTYGNNRSKHGGFFLER